MTLSCISKATGLQKSSLYHFFPGGKSQIGLEILLFVDEKLSQEFSRFLEKKDTSVINFYNALDVLCEFYQDGKQSCLLDIMSIANQDPKIQEACQNLLQKLVDSLTATLVECSVTQDEAGKRAIEAVILLQGSLILSRATGQNSFFLNCIQTLKERGAKWNENTDS